MSRLRLLVAGLVALVLAGCLAAAPVDEHESRALAVEGFREGESAAFQPPPPSDLRIAIDGPALTGRPVAMRVEAGAATPTLRDVLWRVSDPLAAEPVLMAGRVAEHAFSAPGSHEVHVSARDAYGRTFEARAVVDVLGLR